MKKEIREQVYNKCEGRCAYCGEELILGSMQVDHIRPKRNFSYGLRSEIPNYSVDDIRNLNPSCRKCNNFKTAMSLEEFRLELERQIERARRYSVNFRMAEKYGLIQVEERPIVFYFEAL
jgi:5-methylcytosine-specific restriction endonuclease McrA